MSFTHLSLTQRLAPLARLKESHELCLCRLIHGFLPRVSCSFLPLRSGYARSMPPLPERTMRGVVPHRRVHSRRGGAYPELPSLRERGGQERDRDLLGRHLRAGAPEGEGGLKPWP